MIDKLVLSQEKISAIRTTMERTGWDCYEAFINMNKIAIRENVSFEDIVEKKLWKNFKIYQAQMLSGSSTIDYGVEVNVNKEAFINAFYSKKQLNALDEIRNGYISFKTISDFLQVELPDELVKIEDNLCEDRIAFRPAHITSKSVFFCVTKDKGALNKVKRIRPLCVIGFPSFVDEYMKIDGLPVIACRNLGSYILDMQEAWRLQFDAQRVAISGSVGKTTTTEMIGNVVRNSRNMYKIEGNQNTTYQICKFLYNIKKDTEVYVQECSGSFLGQLEKSTRVLRPSIFVLTNIGNGHIGNFDGEKALLLYEKTSLDRHAASDGIGVINWDDSLLRKVSFKHKVVSYGIENADADFFGTDIREKDGKISFVVKEKDGRITPVTINAFGDHNVKNALAAFAVGVLLKISRTTIAESLAKYKSNGVRQNLIYLGGRHMYLDCYSATEDSMKTFMLTLNTISVPKDGKKTVVLADIPALGDDSEVVHRRVGKMVAEVNSADEVIFYGTEMSYAAEEALKYGVNCRHTDNQDVLQSWLVEADKKDLLGFKASHKMCLQRVIDNMVGTDFYLHDEMSSDATVCEDSLFKYKCITDYGTVVTSGPKNVERLVFEEKVSDLNVRIIADKAMMGASVSEIVWPDTLNCISAEAFKECHGLEKISFPKSMKYIGKNAFDYCDKLGEVAFLYDSDNEVTIDEFAFTNCPKLKRVVLPSNVKTISDNAFDATNEIMFMCEADSYAEGWLIEHGYNYKLIQ